MKTRQQAVDYGLTFKDTYMETPFRDTNWQLIRVKGSKKAFLWIYERNGFVNEGRSASNYAGEVCNCRISSE